MEAMNARRNGRSNGLKYPVLSDNDIEKMLKDAGEIVYLSELKFTNEMFLEAVNTGNTLSVRPKTAVLTLLQINIKRLMTQVKMDTQI